MTSDTWKDKNGERQERTEWHRVVVFNSNLADLIAELYVLKSSYISYDHIKVSERGSNENFVP